MAEMILSFTHVLEGPIRDAWGLGDIIVTTDKVIYGLYINRKTNLIDAVFLG